MSGCCMPWARWLMPAFAILMSLSVSAAQAAFTTVNASRASEEPHDRILSHIYGRTFTYTSGVGSDLTASGLLARRVHDSAASSGASGTQELDGTSGITVTDSLWLGNFVKATVEAKYAAFGQSFGYFDGASGGTYRRLFKQLGYGYNVDADINNDGIGDGDVDLTLLQNKTLRWARGEPGRSSRTFTSLLSDNSDLMDHLITYRIEGLEDGLLRWVLFWEDEVLGNADWDYNDLVVEITATPSQQIPEPGLLMLPGLALLLLKRRRGA